MLGQMEELLAVGVFDPFVEGGPMDTLHNGAGPCPTASPTVPSGTQPEAAIQVYLTATSPREGSGAPNHWSGMGQVRHFGKPPAPVRRQNMAQISVLNETAPQGRFTDKQP